MQIRFDQGPDGQAAGFSAPNRMIVAETACDVAPALADLARLDDAGFRALFSGSPIKRIGRDRFVRNVLYAIGNSGRGDLREVAQGLCADADDTVRDAAHWAVARLAQG